jgi:hypothetical protein
VSRDLATIYIGAAGRREDGKRHLELVDAFPADTGKLIGGLKKRIAKYSPVGVGIDPAAPGAYLIPDIEKHCGIKVVQPGGREVAAACASMYAGISSREVDARDVRIRPHPKLDAAARAADWKDRGDAKVFDRRQRRRTRRRTDRHGRPGRPRPRDRTAAAGPVLRSLALNT